VVFLEKGKFMAGQWGYYPDKPKKPKVSVSIKKEISDLALKFINTKLKPKHITDIPLEIDRNYISNITTKWYRNYFYFTSILKSNHPDLKDKTLEVKFARIEYLNDKCFKLSYMRHTEQWNEVYTESSIEECFNIIESEQLFFP